jgi:pSer/pThr/pTyr-binding forkhead associated (FHA) protein
VLVDSRVSRHHAEIVPDGAKPRFRDTASTNGTRLNGVAAVAGELAVGDVLRVGDSELAVEADA